MYDFSLKCKQLKEMRIGLLESPDQEIFDNNFEDLLYLLPSLRKLDFICKTQRPVNVLMNCPQITDLRIEMKKDRGPSWISFEIIQGLVKGKKRLEIFDDKGIQLDLNSLELIKIAIKKTALTSAHVTIQVDITLPGALSSYLVETYLRLGRMSHKVCKVKEGSAEAGDGEMKKQGA